MTLVVSVLFSAAYRKDARVGRLWELKDVRLLTSGYAIEEARRNLDRGSRRRRLEERIAGLNLVPALPDRPVPRGVRLPEKDRPILLAALHADAHPPPDRRHDPLRPYLGEEVEGLPILTPGRYLARR